MPAPPRRYKRTGKPGSRNRGHKGEKADTYTEPTEPADLAAASRAKKSEGPNIEAMSDEEYKKFEAGLPPLQRITAKKRRAARKTVSGTSAARALK